MRAWHYLLGGTLMLSKKNKNLFTEKQMPKQQHFALRKFSIGLASVLIGTSFQLLMGQNAKAADEAPVNSVSSTAQNGGGSDFW